jgi:hypothetical protein
MTKVAQSLPARDRGPKVCLRAYILNKKMYICFGFGPSLTESDNLYLITSINNYLFNNKEEKLFFTVFFEC